MRSFVTLSVVLLATRVSATSGFTVPLTKVERADAYLTGSPAEAGRVRAAFLKSRTGPTTVPVTSQVQFYITSVGIGYPPTYYNLLIDTGSSNTFCGVGKAYNQTSTSIPTGQSVVVTYGAGYFAGLEYLDQVTVAPNLVITNQSIGDALSSADFDFPGLNGIIGVGPVGLTIGTLSPAGNATIPTVVDNLVSQGLIQKQVFSVYFAPPTNDSDTNGAMTFGGVDSSLFEGELTYTPLTTTFPSSAYWGINVTSATYANYTIIQNPTAGIVDTGTTQVLLANDFFNVYVQAIPGATWNSSIGLLEIPPDSVSLMHPLEFVIANRVFTLDVHAQLIPQSQNIAWGGVAGKHYSVIGTSGSPSGEGLDFTFGMKFMERYYTVFDADANRVGFAQTKNTGT